MNSKPAKIESLQVLRGIAVALVVYAHIMDTPQSDGSYQKQFFFLENWGAIGLDLFFVISGFIMTMVTSTYVPSRNWKDFIIKRAIRIVPLYWTLSLVALSLNFLKGSPILPEKILKTILFFPVFDTEFVFPIIPVGWSLSLEIYFYLLIAILLKTTGKNLYGWLVAALILLPGIGFLLKPEQQLMKFLTSPLLLEFAFGIVAGLLHRSLSMSNKTKSLAVILTISGKMLMLSSLMIGFSLVDDSALVSENADLALLRVLIWGLPCTLFLSGFILLEYSFKIKMNSVHIKLGDASYSAYLVHTLLLIPFAIKIAKVAAIASPDIIILCSLAFSLAGSILFYQHFEKILTALVSRIYYTKRISSKIFRSESERYFLLRRLFNPRKKAS